MVKVLKLNQQSHSKFLMCLQLFWGFRVFFLTRQDHGCQLKNENNDAWKKVLNEPSHDVIRQHISVLRL